jgi:hypothetical protein
MIDHAAVDRAHARATQEALLEHARMGRSVSEWRDGKVVWIPPAEIFARYGLDEFGRPKPDAERSSSSERLPNDGLQSSQPRAPDGPAMPDVLSTSDGIEFDLREWVKLTRIDHREVIDAQLRSLPQRATVAFALRCAKRGEPLVRLHSLLADAYSVGLDVGQVKRCDGCSDDASADAATADLHKLRALNLGAHGEPGQPIRWNDPRLGPLWPNGEPKWYSEAVQACRDLEERIRTAPDPNAPPPDPALEELFEVRKWLSQLESEGKLDKYRGKYIIAVEKQILASGRDLVRVHPKAEKVAKAKGISLERLVLHFVPGLE